MNTFVGNFYTDSIMHNQNYFTVDAVNGAVVVVVLVGVAVEVVDAGLAGRAEVAVGAFAGAAAGAFAMAGVVAGVAFVSF